MKNRDVNILRYILRHDKIVDLGIGKGYYYYKSDKENVVGVDFDKGNLDIALTHNPKIKTILADVRDTGLSSNEFDLVIMCQLIEHFEDFQPVLDEAKRLCKNDGYFLVGVPLAEVHEKSRHKIKHNRFHYHPIWSEEKITEVGNRLGKIIDLKKLDNSWLMYVKNI